MESNNKDNKQTNQTQKNNFWSLSNLLTYGWFGTLTGVTGGLLVSLNFSYSKFGFIFFVISAAAWVIQGIKNQDHSLIAINAAFLCINSFGVYRWFFL